MSEALSDLGSSVEAGLAARELDKHGRPAPTDGHDGPCANCGTPLIGAHCHACGQMGHVHRSLAALGHDLAHGVFHFEGRIWHTLPLLALHPGELTRRYVHGQRARFVAPMALFLFSVFLMFAAISAFGGDWKMPHAQTGAAKVQLVEQADEAKDALNDLIEDRRHELAGDPNKNVAKLDARIAEKRNDLGILTTLARHMPADGKLSDTKIDTGLKTLDEKIERVKQNPELYAYKLKMASYKFSWALIPISLPFIWILFCLRRDVGLYDHAIFAIYSLSFMTLLIVALLALHAIGVRSWVLWLTMLIVPPLHMYRQLKEAYLLRRFSALWRTAALLMMTGLAGGLFFALLVWLESE